MGILSLFAVPFPWSWMFRSEHNAGVCILPWCVALNSPCFPWGTQLSFRGNGWCLTETPRTMQFPCDDSSEVFGLSVVHQAGCANTLITCLKINLLHALYLLLPPFCLVLPKVLDSPSPHQLLSCREIWKWKMTFIYCPCAISKSEITSPRFRFRPFQVHAVQF